MLGPAGERLIPSVNDSEYAWTPRFRALTLPRMRFPRLWILAFGLVAASGRVAGAETPATAVELLSRQGDDPRWAAPDWDDTGWEKRERRLDGVYNDDVPASTGVFWVRFRIERSAHQAGRPVKQPFFWPRDEPGSPINSVFIAAVYAFELYWDGRLIGRSGVVGATRAVEVVGLIDNLIPVPDELLGPGPHTVALRMSTYHYNFPAPRTGIYLAFENYADRLRYEARQSIMPLIGAGCAVIVAGFCGALFLIVERRRLLLLCGGLSLLIAGFYFLIAWRWLHNDPFTWLFPRYVLITALMTAISLLLTWLLLAQFAVPRRGRWLLALTPLLAAAWVLPLYHWDKTLWQCRAMLVFALVITGRAAGQRRPGARIVLAGVLIGLVALRADENRSMVSPAFLMSLGALVLCVVAGLGAQVQADRRRAREALLTTARLETELLKKNLQPHFLLNTLTAISELIEQDPPGAVLFIDDLADEFRSLARMSGEKLVPLGQELDLCRFHLRVIGRRTGRNHDLVVEGAAEATPVPPALFLTLIENGLVHQQAETGVAFRLVAQPAGTGVHYAFVSPGRTRVLAGRPAGGTGLRYVKARLEESFPGRWTFSQMAVTGGWETIISWQVEPGAGGMA